jgi:hypothetical protein
MQTIIFKKSSKRNRNPLRYYHSIANPVSTQAKTSYFKNPHIKIDLLPRGANFLKLLHSIMNLNTVSLPAKARPIKAT